MSDIPKWNLKIEQLMACNCNWGCPCSFESPPTYGTCESALAYRVVTGKYADVILDGLVWVLVPEGTDMRARLGVFSGHATLIRGSEQTRATQEAFQPEPTPLAAISRGLREKFDPRGILNPGLMG